MRPKDAKKFLSDVRKLIEAEQMVELVNKYEDIQQFFGKFNDIHEISSHLSHIQSQIYLHKEFLTIEEAADYLGFSTSQMYRMTSNKEIPYYKPGGKAIFFRIEDLNDWIRQNRIMPTSELYKQTNLMAGKYNLNHGDRIAPWKGGKRC